MITKKHDQCKYFGYKSCVHKDDEVMKKATQDVPQSASPIYLLLPSSEEIDAICSGCGSFVQK